MQKVLGFVATTVLILGSISCTQQGQRQSNEPLTTATATPAPATPTPTPTAPSTASVKTVGISWQDDASGTPVTTIKVGGTVSWTAAAGAPHSLRRVAATAENGCDELDATFDPTGNLPPGQAVTKTFDKVGIFGYHCGIHKGTPNCKTPPGTGPMPGVIKVVP